ncbi:MAG: hypothetical protein ACYTDW_16840, partial [Planctomycetota bacterium]
SMPFFGRWRSLCRKSRLVARDKLHLDIRHSETADFIRKSSLSLMAVERDKEGQFYEYFTFICQPIG